MRWATFTKHSSFKPATGAALAAFCGLALWQAPVGERWANISYDSLFRFGHRPVTNEVVLVRMDDDAYMGYRQQRGEPWSRGIHASLLQKLADDGCSLVVFDVFFELPGDPEVDAVLAAAMRRQRAIVLMAEQQDASYAAELATIVSFEPKRPTEPFLSVAGANWGVAAVYPDPKDSVVRRHWPVLSPGPYPSLPWRAAQLAGARLSDAPCERWLRYYGKNAGCVNLGYRWALTKPPNFFRDKIVFIGNEPATPQPDGELDEFRTPYTARSGVAVGGVEILATIFLNLMNGDWLRRPPWWLEMLLLLGTGLFLGSALCQLGWMTACGAAIVIALGTMLGAASLSYYTSFWFPWLVIVGGQVPVALAWALLAPKPGPAPVATTLAVSPASPETPDYELVEPPFGSGAFGKVWLARNAVGEWQALKAVYQAKFGENTRPYEMELKGIKRYKPISGKHPGLLRVDFVSRNKPDGYFYYVMELGDGLMSGWEQNPATYKPRDLVSIREQTPRKRLPVRDCVAIVLEVADALAFLHEQRFTHRDIKPSNIIFVNGRPKLADVGLVTDIRPPEDVTSWAGTPGYMPPLPEPPGTVQADIYGLGMVLYVISTGKPPALFPELSATLVDCSAGEKDFILLNSVILKACAPNCAERYPSAREMRIALQKLKQQLQQAW